MALDFQARSDGFRIVRAGSDPEQMIASVKTKQGVKTTAPRKPMTDEEFKARVDTVGVQSAIAERDSASKGATGIVEFHAMPPDDCEITSAVGPLKLSDVKEIVAFLEKQQI